LLHVYLSTLTAASFILQVNSFKSKQLIHVSLSTTDSCGFHFTGKQLSEQLEAASFFHFLHQQMALSLNLNSCTIN
jgi:hypothetical protein